jgi:drug/metabolite transporter (DMT)-like permease
MRNLPLILPFVVVTLVSWGLYGPVLQRGQLYLGDGLSPGSLRPFLCVGIAYSLIALVVPAVLLRIRRERGRWTVRGALWSLLGGAVGALGALGMVLAFKFHGHPVYVMPLVFGLAPVVTTLVTMWMRGRFWKAGPLFVAGVILVVVGTTGVLVFQPRPDGPAEETAGESATGAEAVAMNAAVDAAEHAPTIAEKLVFIPLSIALAALCWGSYGPIMHRGQMKMHGSRLRPFLCVGLAYFVIAVAIPLPLVPFVQEPSGFRFSGTLWSLAGGAAGAIGAMGILMAFNFGGKPLYVMPLVFGGAPIINTVTTLWLNRPGSGLSSLFLASLIVVIVGGGTVLIFAPRRAKSMDGVPPPQPPAAADDGITAVAEIMDRSRSELNSEENERDEDTLNGEETLQ